MRNRSAAKRLDSSPIRGREKPSEPAGKVVEARAVRLDGLRQLLAELEVAVSQVLHLDDGRRELLPLLADADEVLHPCEALCRLAVVRARVRIRVRQALLELGPLGARLRKMRKDL
jgi:hypothetical protein